MSFWRVLNFCICVGALLDSRSFHEQGKSRSDFDDQVDSQFPIGQGFVRNVMFQDDRSVSKGGNDEFIEY
jgi:hypothetical protein